MTNEESEHFKESFRAQMEDSRPPRVLVEETAESRKLNRDMDRLERVLKKIVSAPKAEKSRRDQRPVESEKKRRPEIRESGERSEELPAKDEPPQS